MPFFYPVFESTFDLYQCRLARKFYSVFYTGQATAVAISRNKFLRGDIRGTRAPLRPPWAVSEAEFVELCSRCDDCLRNCPEHILVRGPSGFPAVDFSRGACTFCHACADVCRPGVLYYEVGLIPWHMSLQISDACLARQGVMCQVCAEQCGEQAITMRPQPGWVPAPEINIERCTGCGACYRPCPTHAIQIYRDPDRHQPKFTEEISE